MAYDNGNIFAKILCGEIPCDVVAENEHALAFRDINPQAPVHVLVIPKGAYESATEFGIKATDREQAALCRLISDVVEVSGIHEDGYRLIANTNRNGHQEVPHYHVHILGGGDLGRILP
ncbi:MAG: histidine triad nucleotide-binding protein [Rhodospirillaceae bacterium]|nr:histidine triad nucleotide-binding protein [Rhodospirillaceae bacterium]